MAFSDPQSVTVNAVAQTLPRTSMSDTQGIFRKDDGSITLKIGQADNGRRNRQSVRIDSNKIVPDALNPVLNQRTSMSVTLVVDTPAHGYTLAEKKYVADALVAYLTTSSGARLTQLLGGEI